MGALPVGGYRPYGLTVLRDTINEPEAKCIREAARWLMEEGATVRGFAAEWNAAGLKTTTGKLSSGPVLRRLMMQARLSGRREHHGAVVPGTEGVRPAIITPEQSDRLRELLRDPGRRTNFNSDHRPSYVCADPAHGLHHTYADGSSLPPDSQGRGTCGNGRLRMNAEPFEEFVREAVFAVLDSPELTAAVRADTGSEDATAPLWAELDAAQRRAAKLDEDFYVTGAITDEGRFRQLRGMQDKVVEDIRVKLDRAQAAASRRALPIGSDRARELWADRGLEWRHNLIGSVADKILVGPGVRGRNTFDHRRVVIVWKHATTAPELPWAG